jgi:membrane dipeptidase
MTGSSMDRRSFLRLAGATVLAPVTGGCGDRGGSAGSPQSGGAGGPSAGVSGSIAEGVPWPGYDEATVIDALASPIQFNIPQEGLPLSEAAIAAVRDSGITALNLTVNAQAREGVSALDATDAKMTAWAEQIASRQDVFRLVESVEDSDDCKGTGRLGIVFGFQDGVPFEDDLDRIADFYARGLRIVQLTYNIQNRLGSGSLVPADGGLTDVGREAVARLNGSGVLVDLSHSGARTTTDGILASTAPVAVTHSGCSAVYAHPRNKDDETLRLLADRGGVVGVYLMPFLNSSGPPTAEDVLAHIEHALSVCGEDHVGIGTDQGIVPLDVSGDFRARFDAVSAQRASAGIAAPREDTVPYVPELNHPRRLETIAGMLAARGRTASVIEKVLGQNFQRLFREVWS